MKSAKVLNLKSWLSTFSFAFLAFMVFGCNGSSQRPYGRLGTASTDVLILEAARIVRESLADDNPQIRANAIEVVAATNEVVAATKQIELMPALQQLLKDEFVPVRFSAALAVGDLEYHLAERQIVRLLKDENENVRIAAAYAMGKLGYPAGYEPIRKAITSRDGVLRANAALLLGKSGDKTALKLLYWALMDENSDDRVRLQALEAIAMLGDQRIYPKLWTRLISAYADDRVVGIKAMGALGIVQAKNALITMLDDDVLEVRLAAAEQLGMLGDTIGEPVVLDVFSKDLTAGLDKDDLERVNMFTALAIGQIGTPSLTKFLPQLLKNQSKPVRLTAAKAVLQCIKGRTVKE